MEISGANAIITHVVEKEQCTVKRILSHRQHTDGSGAPTRGYLHVVHVTGREGSIYLCNAIPGVSLSSRWLFALPQT